MTAPVVTIDLAKVCENARKVVDRCAQDDIRVVGMTKGVCGLPAVAKAMLKGGIEVLGDSRLENIARLRRAGIEAPILLSRSCSPQEVSQCVELADMSAQVSMEVLEALSNEAQRQGRPHGILLMVEMETQREGLLPDEVPIFCERVLELDALHLYGLGCYFPNRDDPQYYLRNLSQMVALKRDLEARFGVTIPTISGGSSNIFTGLTLNGLHVQGVNELRIGTAALVGTAWTAGPEYIPGFHGDAFRLEAELIEIKERHGEIRGLLALGSIDTDVGFLCPLAENIHIVEASNDHTLVTFNDPNPIPRVGDRVGFDLTYPSLAQLMASPYIRFQFQGIPGVHRP